MTKAASCVLCALCLFIAAAAAVPARAELSYGIDALPTDSIDGRGDINLNDLAYEVADVLLMERLLVEGPTILEYPEPSTVNSDINNDDIEMGLDDLVLLVRIVVGDEVPLPGLKDATDTALIVNYSASSRVVVSYPVDLGAALFVFDGEVSVATSVPSCAVTQHFDGYITRALVTRDQIFVMGGGMPTFPAGEIITYSGDGQLVGAAVADGEGVTSIPVDIVGGQDIGRGDLNLNNIPYEAADFMAYRDYLVKGFDSTDDTLRLKNASNANGDGHSLTLDDISYLGKIVLGGAGPIAGPTYLPDSLTGLSQQFNSGYVALIHPSRATAVRFYFDRHTDLGLRADTIGFILDTALVDGKTVATVLPKLMPRSDTLAVLPFDVVSTLSFGLVDSGIAGTPRLIRNKMKTFPLEPSLIMTNDTVFNIVHVEYPDPMEGANLIFSGIVQPELLIDGFVMASPSGHGATVVGILQSSPFGSWTIETGNLIRYSGRGALARGEAIDKYRQRLIYSIVNITAGKLGDVSMDDSVDGADLQWLVEYLFHDDLSILGIHAADMDRDGEVSPVDLCLLVDLLYN